MSEYIASLYASTAKPYRSTTSHPAMIAHRRRSPLWRVVRELALSGAKSQTASVRLRAAGAIDRLTMGFEYCGPTRPEEAFGFGLMKTRSIDQGH